MTILLRDRQAALAVAAALVYDRSQDVGLPAQVLDQLKYVLDTLQEMQREVDMQTKAVISSISDED